MVLKSGDMERSIEKLVWHLEEPRVTIVSQFLCGKISWKL